MVVVILWCIKILPHCVVTGNLYNIVSQLYFNFLKKADDKRTGATYRCKVGHWAIWGDAIQLSYPRYMWLYNHFPADGSKVSRGRCVSHSSKTAKVTAKLSWRLYLFALNSKLFYHRNNWGSPPYSLANANCRPPSIFNWVYLSIPSKEQFRKLWCDTMAGCSTKIYFLKAIYSDVTDRLSEFDQRCLLLHWNKTNLTVSTSTYAACSEFVQSAWFQVGESVLCSRPTVGHFPLTRCKRRPRVSLCLL